MGYRVKDIRQAQGITQEELAQKSGVSRGTICSLENNSNKNVTTGTLVKIAMALGVTVDDIFFAQDV